MKSLFTLQGIPCADKKVDRYRQSEFTRFKNHWQTDSWDTLIIYLVVTKLDSITEREWENHKGTITSDLRSDLSLKLDNLLSFVKNRADMLEMISLSHNKNTHTSKFQQESKPSNMDLKKTLFKSQQHAHSYVTTRNKQSEKQNKQFV